MKEDPIKGGVSLFNVFAGARSAKREHGRFKESGRLRRFPGISIKCQMLIGSESTGMTDVARFCIMGESIRGVSPPTLNV